MFKATMVLLILSLFFIQMKSLAAERVDEFPENIERFELSFVLNGKALKEVTFMKFDVYWVALYLLKKSVNADEIIASQDRKLIQIRFVRNVPADKLSASWIMDLKSACKENCEELLAEASSLGKGMPSIKLGESVYYDLHESGVEVSVGDQKIGKLISPGVAKLVLEIFIGKKADLELKKPLLSLPLN